MARGGAQHLPRPAGWRPGNPNPWWGRLTPDQLTPEWIEARLGDLSAGRIAALSGPPMRPPVLVSKGQAAVLAPLFIGPAGDVRLLFTRRSSRLSTHSGEVAFPGGRVDEGETLEQTALREAHEEVGLSPDRVRILGRLEPLSTRISLAAITPFVGLIEELPPLTPSPREVDRIFDVGLAELIEPDCFREELWPLGEDSSVEHGDHFSVYVFEVEGDTIWGATGRMVHRLLSLLL